MAICANRSRLFPTGAAGLAAALLGSLVGALPSDAADRLYEQEPYDLITLDAANNNEVLKVERLDLPNREIPTDPHPSDKLIVRLLDKPEQTYELRWRSIEKVELFEQLVLKKANELVAQGKLEEAYDYFEFLEKSHPDLPGLNDGMLGLLHAEVIMLLGDDKYAGALAMLQEMHRRDPQRTNLDRVMGETTEKLLERHLAKGDYRPGRVLLRNLAQRYPNHPVVATRQSRLQQDAAKVLGEARQARQAGQYARASQLCRQAAEIWPALPEIKPLAEQIHREYPRVVVGVSVTASDWRPGRLGDWASRRSSRLLFRTLTELTAPSTAGGQYDCPMGEVMIYPTERRLELNIRPGLHWSSPSGTADSADSPRPTLTGYDVSRRLLAMADPEDPAYRVDWAMLFGSVTVHEVYRIDVKLRRPHVRPDALLQTLLLPYTTPGAVHEPPPSNGPYFVRSATADEVTYSASGEYWGYGIGDLGISGSGDFIVGGSPKSPNPQIPPTQPKEIVERRFAKGALAIRALEQGNVQLLDRVNPWGLDVVRADRNLQLRAYRLPLLHCLIPNVHKPLTARRTFRRALVYGIHRQAILDQLTGDQELEGCQVVSGPFLPGSSRQDEIGYAYDGRIKPRDYDPRMALALSGVGVQQWIDSEEKKGREAPQDMPRLVLAHPPHEIARLACQSIQQQLGLIGIPIDLQELPGGVPARIPEQVDLLYAEVAIWEPVVDARRLLGEEGMAGGCSSYMSQALRRLERASDWREVRDELLRIHRIAHDDVAVIPLWQLTDYFAYHKSLRGFAPRTVSASPPVTLYENVETWQPSLPYSLAVTPGVTAK